MSKFIVFEGLDGTGKTTQIKKLAEYLEKKGEKVFITAEPTSLPTGKLLRRILSGEVTASPWSAAALFLSDRIQHNCDSENGIIKHLEQGETVICDRYYFSTFAYQGKDTDIDWAMNMHYNCPQIKKPDLVLFLTMPPEKCIERIRANRKEEDIEIFENINALTKISERFDSVFDKIKDKENIVYINAYGSVEEITQRIIKAVNGEN